MKDDIEWIDILPKNKDEIISVVARSSKYNYMLYTYSWNASNDGFVGNLYGTNEEDHEILSKIFEYDVLLYLNYIC